MRQILKNAFIIKKGNEGIVRDIAIEDGMIVAIDENLEGDVITDLQGKCVMPGLVDVHVHLREPGFTDKETIKTGSMAAARGGYTTICAMPNTNPVPDTKEVMDQINEIIKRDALVNVYQYAPITENLRSNQLVDMKNIDAFAYTNDGVGVQTADVMYEAMLEAKKIGKPIVAHTEDESLLYGGVMHEGIRNKELGLKGMLGLTESTQIARDVLLAKETGVHYHVCHVSDADSVAAIRFGKSIGAHVTSEVSPHHLLLNEMDIPGNDSNYKMNPPLRAKEDQEELLKALKDGSIEMIATDHAPHTHEDKSGGFETSPFGIIGSEIAFPLLYTELVIKNEVTLENLQNWMSIVPNKVFNLGNGTLEVGSKADISVFDLETPVVLEEKEFKSKSLNTPFLNKTVMGMCVLTLVEGETVWNVL